MVYLTTEVSQGRLETFHSSLNSFLLFQPIDPSSIASNKNNFYYLDTLIESFTKSERLSLATQLRS